MTDDELSVGERDDCSADELAFWGLEPETRASFVLHEDAPPVTSDLEERTAKFGEQIILFAKKILFNPVNNRLIDQLVGAGTSVGANYCEADDGVSRADFRHRIGICRKEARALPLIFSKIWRNTRL